MVCKLLHCINWKSVCGMLEGKIYYVHHHVPHFNLKCGWYIFHEKAVYRSFWHFKFQGWIFALYAQQLTIRMLFNTKAKFLFYIFINRIYIYVKNWRGWTRETVFPSSKKWMGHVSPVLRSQDHKWFDRNYSLKYMWTCVLHIQTQSQRCRRHKYSVLLIFQD